VALARVIAVPAKVEFRELSMVSAVTPPVLRNKEFALLV
jgi:hypothetical protein